MAICPGSNQMPQLVGANYVWWKNPTGHCAKCWRTLPTDQFGRVIEHEMDE